MRANVLTIPEPWTLDISSVDIGEPGVNDTVVAPTQVALCGGESDGYRGHWLPESYGQRIGHEMAGIVEWVGAGVTHLRCGDLVVGHTPRGDVMADYAIVNAGTLFAISPDLTTFPAVAEPLMCIMAAIVKAEVQPGDVAAIIGVGYMGLLAQMVLQRLGVHVITTGRRDPAIERSRQIGATRVVDLRTESLVEVVRDYKTGIYRYMTGKDPVPDASLLRNDAPEYFLADIALEATGVQAGYEMMMEVVAMEGRAACIGYHQSNQGERSANVERMNYKAFDQPAGHVRDPDRVSRGFRDAMWQVATGLPVDQLATHHVGFTRADLERGFGIATAKEGDLQYDPEFVKLVIHPN